MAQQFKAAIFDLDGTLLDTSEGVLAAVRYTIDYYGFRPMREAQLREFIGPPIQNSFAKAYGLEGAILQEIATTFRNRYKDVDLLKAVPYEGIYDVFQVLTECGITTAVATYKRQDYAVELLRHFNFNRYTNLMYGADHENKLKKSDIIRKAIFDAGVEKFHEVVMIGDSDNDALGAEMLGIKFIGVTYGFGFRTKEDIEQFPNIGTARDTKEISNLIIRRCKNESEGGEIYSGFSG